VTRKVTGRILTGGIAMETGRPGSRSDVLLRRISRRCIPSLILCKTDRKESMQWVVQHLNLGGRQQADVTPGLVNKQTLLRGSSTSRHYFGARQQADVTPGLVNKQTSLRGSSTSRRHSGGRQQADVTPGLVNKQTSHRGSSTSRRHSGGRQQADSGYSYN
jgi:hypothetical protein